MVTFNTPPVINFLHFLIPFQMIILVEKQYCNFPKNRILEKQKKIKNEDQWYFVIISLAYDSNACLFGWEQREVS